MVRVVRGKYEWPSLPAWCTPVKTNQPVTPATKRRDPQHMRKVTHRCKDS